MRETQTEVLVVGAGPVGLLAALLLAENGVQVTIIDREERVTARSYACALHSSVLRMLEHKLKMAQPLIERGRKIEHIGFYDKQTRRASIDLSVLGESYPFIVTLPQSELESALEQRLRKVGVTVHWNHRFKDFNEGTELVETTIEELGGTGTGYIVPHWEMVVKKELSLRAQFVIGADGANSTLRQRLHVAAERMSEVSSFAAYEFEAEQPVQNELSVVLDGTTNVLWPLPNNRCRWTFQLLHAELAEFPEKERRAARVANPNVDERIREYVQKAAAKRAPWFKSGVKDIAWCTEVSFEQRVASEFGRNRCWLAGDAAHQTGPVGVQSMNSGLLEAASLAQSIWQILRQEKGAGSLRHYGQKEVQDWLRLAGFGKGLEARNDTDPWVKANLARILPCLPGLGSDLTKLAAALKTSWS